jgi:hypothetical protein
VSGEAAEYRAAPVFMKHWATAVSIISGSPRLAVWKIRVGRWLGVAVEAADAWLVSAYQRAWARAVTA